MLKALTVGFTAEPNCGPVIEQLPEVVVPSPGPVTPHFPSVFKTAADADVATDAVSINISPHVRRSFACSLLIKVM
jgi:hypothetical protein